MKKFFAVALSIAMLLTAASPVAFADAGEPNPDAPVTGVTFNNEDYSPILTLKDGEYMQLEGDTYIASDVAEGAVAQFTGATDEMPATLTLMGDVPGFMFTGIMTIKLAANVSVGHYGAVYEGEGYEGSAFGFNIRGTGTYTIDAAPYTLTVEAPDVSNPTGNAFSAAISNSHPEGSLIVESGTIIATGGNVEGVYCGSYGFNSYGKLFVNGGTIRAYGDSAKGGGISYTHGLRAAETITVSGGNITAAGGVVEGVTQAENSAFESVAIFDGDYVDGGYALYTGDTNVADTFNANPDDDAMLSRALQIAPYAQSVEFRDADANIIASLTDGDFLHPDGSGYKVARGVSGALAKFEGADEDGPATLTLMADVPAFTVTGDLTINLTDDVVVDNYMGISTDNMFSFNIRATGNLTLDLGEFSLTATTEDVVNAEGNAFAAAVSNNDTDKVLTMRSGTLIVHGGMTEASGFTSNYGLNSYGRLVLEGGEVIATTGSATAPLSAESYPIRSGVTTTLTGGKYTATAGESVKSMAFDKAPILGGDYAAGKYMLMSGADADSASYASATTAASWANAYVMAETTDTVMVSDFTDVSIEDWFFNAVIYLTGESLMSGMTETTFEPGTETSRAMATVMLHRIAGEPTATEFKTFTDVVEGAWYETAVQWASSTGVVTGDGEMFRPDDSLTREQFAAILYRYTAPEGEFTGGEIYENAADSESISDWAMDAMMWAVETGIITGEGDMLNPQGTVTRAQLAVMLHRYLVA